MKVICNRGALLEALTVTGNAVQARTPKPVLLCVKLTAADDRLTIGATDLEVAIRYTDNLVLVELSFAVPAINLREILFDMQLKGYQPVLAHPERYLYFGANRKWYDQLRYAGCLFQLNLLSIAGHYGPESRRLVEYLIKKQYVDLLGTDMHHETHLEVLKSSEKIHRTVGELMETGLIKNPEL